MSTPGKDHRDNRHEDSGTNRPSGPVEKLITRKSEVAATPGIAHQDILSSHPVREPAILNIPAHREKYTGSPERCSKPRSLLKRPGVRWILPTKAHQTSSTGSSAIALLCRHCRAIPPKFRRHKLLIPRSPRPPGFIIVPATMAGSWVVPAVDRRRCQIRSYQNNAPYENNMLHPVALYTGWEKDSLEYSQRRKNLRMIRFAPNHTDSVVYRCRWPIIAVIRPGTVREYYRRFLQRLPR